MKKLLALLLSIVMLFSFALASSEAMQPTEEDATRAAEFYDFLDHNSVLFTSKEYETDTLWLGYGETQAVITYSITAGSNFKIVNIDDPHNDSQTKKYVLDINNDDTYANANMSQLLLGFGTAFSNQTQENAYTILTYLMQNYATELASGDQAKLEKDGYTYTLFMCVNNSYNKLSNSQYTGECTQYIIQPEDSELEPTESVSEASSSEIQVSGTGELDLSGMNYDDLVALKNEINLALWSSDEWQEVSVPCGVYTIGEDIPAGKWIIKAADGVYASILWGDLLDESGVSLSWAGDIYEYETVYSPTYKRYDKGIDKTEVAYTLEDGQYFIVDDGTAVFTPYAGSADLGFKK